MIILCALVLEHGRDCIKWKFIHIQTVIFYCSVDEECNKKLNSYHYLNIYMNVLRVYYGYSVFVKGFEHEFIFKCVAVEEWRRTTDEIWEVDRLRPWR